MPERITLQNGRIEDCAVLASYQTENLLVAKDERDRLFVAGHKAGEWQEVPAFDIFNILIRADKLHSASIQCLDILNKVNS